MAPEQITGKPRPASDQYALGIVLYELLSGDRPFHGSLIEIATQHLMTPPAPLDGRVPGMTRALQEVVFTALAKDPQQRFANMEAFAIAFEQACRAAPRSSFSLASGADALQPTPLPPSASNIGLQGQSQQLPSLETFSGESQQPTYIHPLVSQSQQSPLITTPLDLSHPTSGNPTGNSLQEPTVMNWSANPLLTPPPTPFGSSSLEPRLTPPSSSPLPLRNEIPAASLQQREMLTRPVPSPHQPAGVSPSPGRGTPDWAGDQTSLRPSEHSETLVPLPPILLRRKRNTPATMTVLAFLALFILSSGGLTFYYTSTGHFPWSTTRNGPATTFANNATMTALSDSATATAQAINNATATAQAINNATATAQAINAANPNPYSPNTGTLAFIDPLSQPYEWTNQTFSDNSGCHFTGGVYHLVGGTSNVGDVVCPASFTIPAGVSFVFEAQITFVNTTQGNCGGIEFEDNVGDQFSAGLCPGPRGAYADTLYFAHGGTNFGGPIVSSFVPQTDLLAIVVTGHTFIVYLNNRQILSKTDDRINTSQAQGTVDLWMGNNPSDDLAFSNAKLWELRS